MFSLLVSDNHLFNDFLFFYHSTQSKAMKPPKRKVSVKETEKMLLKIKNNTSAFLKIVVYRKTRNRKRVLHERSAREK